MTPKVKKQLENGELPLGHEEALRLITADHDLVNAERFQQQMTALIKEFLSEEEFKILEKQGGVKFMLMDDDSLNAAHVTHSKPSIVVISKGMMEAFRPENLQRKAREWEQAGIAVPPYFAQNGKAMLIGIIAHELTHSFYKGNSKGVEAACDIFGVEKLLANNYHPLSLADALDYLLRSPGEIQQGFASAPQYLDEHPLDHTRRIAMKHHILKMEAKGIGIALDETLAITPRKVEALDDTIFSTAFNASYASALEIMLGNKGYAQADNLGKLRILRDIVINEVPNWNDEEHAPRLEVLSAYIASLYITKHLYAADSPEKVLLDEMADFVLGVTPRDQNNKWYASRLFNTLSRTWHDTAYLTPPIGSYEKLTADIKKFFKAQHHQEATKLAEKIESYKLTRFSPAGVYINLPSFKTPQVSQLLETQKRILQVSNDDVMPGADDVPENLAKQYGLEPEWHRLVTFAGDKNNTVPDNPLTRTLYRLGLTPELAPTLPMLETERQNELSDSLSSIEGTEDLLIASNGYIVGTTLTESSWRTLTSQRAEFKEWRLKLEARKLDRITITDEEWKLVSDLKTQTDESNIETFVDKYVDILADIRNPQGSAIQKRFVEEVIKATQNASVSNPSWNDYKERLSSSFRAISDSRLVPKIEQTDYAISLNHPYIELIAANPQEVFSPYIIGSTLNATLPSTLNDIEGREFASTHIAEYRKILGYNPPTTPDELSALYKKYKINLSYGHSIIKHIMAHEFNEFFAQQPEAVLSAEQLQEIYALGYDRHQPRLREPYESIISTYIQKHVEEELALDTAALVQHYNMHQASSIFKDDLQLRSRYESTIVEKINATEDITERKKLLDALVLADVGPKVNGRSSDKFLNEPNFRNWAVAAWIECTAISMKSATPPYVDTDTPEYRKEAEAVIQDLLQRASGITRYDMLTGFLSRIQAQRHLSYYAEDKHKELTKEKIENLHLEVSAGEAFLDHLALDPEFRQQSIFFFKNPCNKEAARIYSEQARASLDRLTSPQNTLLPQEVKEKLERMKDSTTAKLYHYDDITSVYNAQMLHRNFSAAPMEYRAAIMREVLYPSHPNAVLMTDPQGNDVDIQQYVLDIALPLSQDTAESRFNEYGQTMIGGYLSSFKDDEVERFSRQMYTAAVLVAEDPTALELDEHGNPLKPEVRAGKAIHTLLRTMDNALATKTSQMIDSTPGIPDYMRNPDSKNCQNIPPMWEIHHLFDQHADEEIKATTKRLGAVRAGAIGIAITLDKDLDKMAAISEEEKRYAIQAPRTVFKIGREGGLEKVVQQEARVLGMMEKAVAKHPELAMAQSIVQQAIKSAKIETQFENAPKQTCIATTLTDGMQVKVGDRVFTFREVPLLKDNDTSHEMPWAPGTLFNSLPEDQKKIAGQALFAAENYLALSGYNVDWDRHGMQAIINGDTIYLIDRGGMMLKPPSQEDKQLFGKTLATAFNRFFADMFSDSTQKISFDKAYTDAVNEANAALEEPNDYLATMSRAQHNLGDLRDKLSQEEQFMALTAVFHANAIDQTIVTTLKENIDKNYQDLLNSFLDADSMISPISITHPNRERWKTLDNIETLMQEYKANRHKPIEWDTDSIKLDYIPSTKVESRYTLPEYDPTIYQPLEPTVTVAPAVTNSDPTVNTPSSASRRSDNTQQSNASSSSVSTGDSLIEAGIGAAAVVAGIRGISTLNKTIAEQKERGEKTTWQQRLKRGALGFAVVTGVALAVDAITGAHAMRALSSKISTGSWRARA